MGQILIDQFLFLKIVFILHLELHNFIYISLSMQKKYVSGQIGRFSSKSHQQVLETEGQVSKSYFHNIDSRRYIQINLKQCQDRSAQIKQNNNNQPFTSQLSFIKPTKKIKGGKQIELKEISPMTNSNRQNKKKMSELIKTTQLIKLFHQKITLNSVLRKPIDYDPLDQFTSNGNCCLENTRIKIPQLIKNIIYTSKSLYLILYLMLFPLSLLFQNIATSNFLLNMKIFGIIFLIIDLLDKFTGKEINIYNNQKFLQERRQFHHKTILLLICCVFTVLSIVMIEQDIEAGNFLFISIAFTIPYYTEQISYLEYRFFSTTTYINKYWNLIKVIGMNIFVGHLLACILIAITLVNRQNNWMTNNEIDSFQWYQQYIWSYYFGTTIILTIGFGDLHAVNTVQAFFIIIISFFACLFFGYNINYIGHLIDSIRQQELQKNNKLKILNSLSSKSEVSKTVCDEITNYIIESAKIKQQYNETQEKKLLNDLPQSLKSSFIRQANHKLFNKLREIIPFTDKTIERLCLRIEAKLCHPQKIVKTALDEQNILILQSGKVGLVTLSKYPSKLRNVVIETLQNKPLQSRLICVDLLTNQSINYGIKSVDYSIIYQMRKRQFEQSIVQSKKDYQAYRQLLDRCKYKFNEFSLIQCQFCPNKKHNLFQCPRLHYQPFRKTIPFKYFSRFNGKQQRIKYYRTKNRRIQEIIIETKSQFYFNELMSSANQDITLQQQTLLPQLKIIKKNRTKCLRPSNESLFVTMQGLAQIRNDIQDIKKDEIKFKFDLWQNIDCDEVHNYQFYFVNQNSNQLGQKQIKNTLMNWTSRIKRKPKVCTWN